jgi:hypothetical protein
MAIHEGGTAQFGSKMSVLQIGRTKFDFEDEVPSLGVGDGEFESDRWSVPMGKGRKVYRVTGEIWKTEWIAPARSSPRVAGDKEASTSYFIVSGFNVAPAGGVSKELAAAQAQGKPADTMAPEIGIVPLLKRLGHAVKKRYGIGLYSSEINLNILKKAHRFTAVDEDGLLNLAKDLTRLFADRVDAKGLQKGTLPQPPAKAVGSLKAVEYMLATILQAERAAQFCAALFGIYDLRKADAHIPSSDLDEDYRRANVDRRKPLVWQGHDMLLAFVVTLSNIADIVETSEREAA